jgi:glutamate dehydrogenase (NADP+)
MHSFLIIYLRLIPFLEPLFKKYQHQPTFLQAVKEMSSSLEPLFNDPKEGEFYKRAFVAIAEPERQIAFRVSWEDDNGVLQFNRGWRIEFSSVLGPYKGGLRFHPTVDEGVLKFLGFEQIFKNALTGLPMGGAKGGSDFDPKGKSDNEVRRFCQSFMTELYRYIGPDTDVPAGDIGVGSREIGALYGQYRRLTNKHGVGVLTGKSVLWGGSNIRPEATGYGCVYMAEIVLEQKYGPGFLKGKACGVSGSGNVAQYTAEKLIELGAKVMTMSDSNGVLVFEQGLSKEDLAKIMHCKNVQRGRLSNLEGHVNAKYIPGESTWSIDTKYDVAFPCATQNEITAAGAKKLMVDGCKACAEGANLPSDLEAQEIYRTIPDFVYIPGKAANAGGVGVSGLEMSQNSLRLQWSRKEVDDKLKDMMRSIYDAMIKTKTARTLEEGANQAGFVKVANAMREQGLIW